MWSLSTGKTRQELRLSPRHCEAVRACVGPYPGKQSLSTDSPGGSLTVFTKCCLRKALATWLM